MENLESNNQIVERLKLARETLGLTQDEMAHRLGIAKMRYTPYEYGRVRIPTEILIKIGEMGIRINWLLMGEGAILNEPETEPSFQERIVTPMGYFLEDTDRRVDKLEAENAELRERLDTLEHSGREAQIWQERFLALANAHQTLQRQHEDLSLRCEGLFAELGQYVEDFHYGNPYKGPMEDEIIEMQKQKLEKSLAELKGKNA